MDKIGAVSDVILESKRSIIFTGAGISTESGIPDFRSPSGIWDKFDPEMFSYQHLISSESSREKYWELYRLLWMILAEAAPNRGHYAIARLYQLGRLDCIITQNVDSLHQKSGVPEDRVIELHGTTMWVVCLECGRRFHREEIFCRLQQGEKVPTCCDCHGILKPATISFGQPMPEKAVREATAKSADCDLFLVAGSSLQVYPAARMPLIAKEHGAKLVVINLTPTPHDGYADITIHERTGESLAQIAKRVEAALRSNVLRR